VREDKERESSDGFDGTWVAHPDLVPVAREPFQNVLRDRPHQKERLREDVQVTAEDLLNVRIDGGAVTEEGVRNNISVALLYLESWLRGTGAVAIYNLMEDAATAEISRSQLWQWVHNAEAKLSDGREITPELFSRFLPEELDKIKQLVGERRYESGQFDTASRILQQLVLDTNFTEFLTLIAYNHLT